MSCNYRQRRPKDIKHFSNPDVLFEGEPTGTHEVHTSDPRGES